MMKHGRRLFKLATVGALIWSLSACCVLVSGAGACFPGWGGGPGGHDHGGGHGGGGPGGGRGDWRFQNQDRR